MATSHAWATVGSLVSPAAAASAEISPASVDVGVGDRAAGGVGGEDDVDAVRVADVDVGVVAGPLGGRRPRRARTAAAPSNDPARNVASMRPRRNRQSGRSPRAWNWVAVTVSAIVEP